MLKRLSLAATSSLAVLTMSSPALASFHVMKIEQAIGGVGGQTNQQAIQLRLRALGQNMVGSAQARLIARDAAGQNPVTLIVFPSNPANNAQGARILVVSPAFAAAQPGITADFTMTSLIPNSYLAAGRLTFEDGVGTIYWSLSWGGAGYTGPTTGSITNDSDGNFGPSFGAALPSAGTQALRFSSPDATGDAPSTSNLSNYSVTAGAATFTNNAGASGTVVPPSPAHFYTLAPCRVVDTRSGSPLQANSTTDFPVATVCGVPADARAVAVIVTAVQETEMGDLRLYPTGGALPLASAINFVANRARANNAVVGLGTSGRVSIRCDMAAGSAGTTHVILDVLGYLR